MYFKHTFEMTIIQKSSQNLFLLTFYNKYKFQMFRIKILPNMYNTRKS